jgi:hypothetical protein
VDGKSASIVTPRKRFARNDPGCGPGRRRGRGCSGPADLRLPAREPCPGPAGAAPLERPRPGLPVRLLWSEPKPSADASA